MWEWTLDDLLDAHIVLDAFQESAAKAEDKAKAERDAKSTTKVMSLRSSRE